MGDLLGIAVLILYFVIAISSDKKKKKRQKQQKAADGFDQAFGGGTASKTNVRPEPARVQTAAKAVEDCTTKRIHLHEVSQAAFGLAGEGEDPCHPGEAEDEPEKNLIYAAEEADPEQSARAQELLRGVIMSEILTRPCDRAALRRNRRSAI